MQRKSDVYLKKALIMLIFVLVLDVTACSYTPSQDSSASVNAANKMQMGSSANQSIEEMINSCSGTYESAAKEQKFDDLAVVQTVVNHLGECGYPAVDSRNLVDMTEADKVLDFCQKVDAREEAEITIFVIDHLGGMIQNNLYTEEGSVTVDMSYYEYTSGGMEKTNEGSYQTTSWNYTDEGYLMYSGIWFSKDMYVLSLGGVEEYTALRVQHLDETCRELCLKYLRPIGFERNNLFITDWNEGDFGQLDFYDLFDRLYPKVYGEQNPYKLDDNLSVGAVYQIPKEEFEKVIMSCFDIDSTTLQSKTVYHPADATYEYRPRGFREIECPEYPYSEVVEYTENSDGTITLLANVVFPRTGNSKVFSHEVVIRLLEDGGVKYVSNRIVPAEDNTKETWYTPRLTQEEWNIIYGNK